MVSIRRMAILFFTLLLAFGSFGVWASWNYFDLADPVADNMGLVLQGFYYKTEEILPNDGSHDQNAVGFVQYVIYDVKAGLNSKKGNAIFSQLKNQRDFMLHSKDTITNSNFDHIFSDTESEALEFTMEYVSDTQIRLYVYLDAELDKAGDLLREAQSTGQPLTVRITTYVTMVERSASEELDWDDKGSAKGNAVVVNDGSFYVIDPSTWNALETSVAKEEQA